MEHYKRPGQPRYGATEREAEAVALVVQMRREDHTFKEICEALEANFFTPRFGKKWYPMTVQGIWHKNKHNGR